MQKTQLLFQGGDSFLHRLDPRVKLILAGALVGCLFSSLAPLRLGLIAGIWAVGALLARQSVVHVWRIFRLLKWLLLFSLLLHLFFTPGQTLFGVRWLSLDGLVNGLCVDAQIVLAVLISLLVSLTTSAEDLSSALTSVLSPLRIVKVPVHEIGAMCTLVLYFFPLLKAELLALKPRKGRSGLPVLARLRVWSEQLELVLMKLLDQGDQLACDIVAREAADPSFDRGVAVRPVGVRSLVVLFGGLLVVFLMWRV